LTVAIQEVSALRLLTRAEAPAGDCLPPPDGQFNRALFASMFDLLRPEYQALLSQLILDFLALEADSRQGEEGQSGIPD
jgi:hypothetical protein